jgi:hypothetical protein
VPTEAVGLTIELCGTEAQLAQQQLQFGALVVAVPCGRVHVLPACVRLVHRVENQSQQIAGVHCTGCTYSN